ncbi:nudix-type nucleoside diphosphatase (YffH/AdpP family) [Gramella sp. Hel_I_59]|uniref:GDP-mannose pyrophosphatase NudK n=1 Tax=Gramella sp. Hel_I_59 TaxID=1249978 RepID=UPI001151196F|nr:GDP-mannose pyrophosphatase NudK [Gramella sp. Hel_I_59]TQI71299.1 nudix-type nucleoside diphosphatase (YffH/AdpP family) [Gramella sp. Hel_I_59]
MKQERVDNLEIEILSDNWYTLKKVNFDFRKNDGNWERQSREAYDRGNGAAILLYNLEKKTVILTRQFRMPTFLNGNSSGIMIEVCAGLLDQDSAEDCIRRETQEETGYEISNVEKVFEAYMSPGSVTEIVHFFIAEYHEDMKISEGGGVAEEQEDIEVLELKFYDALKMIKTGKIKDGKTIMLLQHLQLKLLQADS